MKNPKEQLAGATNAITTALAVLKIEMPVMEAFLKECRDMESIGPIVNPILFRDPERRAVEALMKPIFQAAVDFVHVYDDHTAKAKDALRKVSA